MGIVHHSNYLRLCEEARVEWCKNKGLLSEKIESIFSLCVLETRVKHLKPLRYPDIFEIQMQTKIHGIKLLFQYRISVKGTVVCTAETTHCSLDPNFKAIRLSDELKSMVESEVWTETWL